MGPHRLPGCLPCQNFTPQQRLAAMLGLLSRAARGGIILLSIIKSKVSLALSIC